MHAVQHPVVNLLYEDFEKRLRFYPAFFNLFYVTFLIKNRIIKKPIHTAMEIINVITIENDVIQNVDTYKKDDVELAEKAFLDKAREYGWTPDEISESDLLDEGRYETEFTVYANVNLVWSTIKNMKS